jgi:hypothetical protein
MSTKQRYAVAAGLVLVLAGASGVGQSAALQTAPVDACALLTQEEAGAILGTAAAAPEKGSGSTCIFAPQAGQGADIMIHLLPLTFGSEEEFHAYLVKETEKTNARIKEQLGDAFKPGTVEPVPEVGKPAYYVDPTLIILKDGRVLSILAADQKQAVAVAAKAVPRF